MTQSFIKRSMAPGLLILAVLLMAVPESAADGPLTLEDFAAKVRAHYPHLKKQHARVEQAIAAKHEALTGFLPRLVGVSSWTRGNDPVYVFGSLLKQEAFTQADFAVDRLNSPESRDNLSVGVEGQWKIFDAFDTISRVRSAGALESSAALTEESLRMEVNLLAVEAFYRAVLQRNLEERARTLRESSLRDVSQAQALNEKGMVLGADYYAAKVSGGFIARMNSRFTRDARSASALLAILMGADPKQAVTPDYDLSPLPASVADLSEWLEAAALYRKDLKALDQTIAAAEHESFRQRMSVLPRVSAFGSLHNDSEDGEHGSGGYVVGLQGRMDLFEPSYGARMDVARLKLAEAREDKRALQDAIARSITEEYYLYQTVVEDLPVTETMMTDAQNAMEQTEKLYHEGKKSVADLLEIRRVYLETVTQAYETRFYAQTCYSRLLFLSGRLDETALGRMAAGLRRR